MVNCKHRVHYTGRWMSLSILISKPGSKPQTCKTRRVNHWCMGGNLGGWAVDDSLSVCCQVSLCCEIRFMTMERACVCERERNPCRLSLVYLDFCFSCVASLPVRRKWVTLARMWLIVVIDTVVVKWPMVEVGGWEMGETGKGENPQWNLAESASR